MSISSQLCNKNGCGNSTRDASGFCYLHIGSGNAAAKPSRAIPKVSSAQGLHSTGSAGWLSESTGIDVSDYSNGSNLSELSDDEQMAEWMKVRVMLRMVESITLRGGSVSESTSDRYEDTSLALAWERINNQSIDEIEKDPTGMTIAGLIKSQVEKRVESGNFSPMNIEGFVNNSVPKSRVAAIG